MLAEERRNGRRRRRFFSWWMEEETIEGQMSLFDMPEWKNENET